MRLTLLHRILIPCAIASAIAPAFTARSDTHYMSLNGQHLTPFTNWTMAATNINALWIAVSNDDTLAVSNGIHIFKTEINVNKSVRIWGPYGAAQTILNGTNGYRGFSVSGASTTCYLDNVTLFNFSSYSLVVFGGKVCAYQSAFNGNTNTGAGSQGSSILVVAGAYLYATNCEIRLNGKTGGGNGGAIYFVGGAVSQGILDRCDVSDNIGNGNGGAIFIEQAGGPGLTARNCRIANNSGGSGGGVLLQGGHRLENCTIMGNTGGTGGGVIMYGGEMVNCLVAYNRGSSGGGVYNWGVLRNCTVVSNSAGGNGGGTAGTVTSINSIVYFNSGAVGFTNYSGGTFTSCCVAPLPAGVGNIATNPMLVNFPADCRLVNGSPCINVGMNESWMINAVDLDGRPRIRQGNVDMGAYEYYFPQGTRLTIR